MGRLAQTLGIPNTNYRSHQMKTLTATELQTAQNLINRSPAGIYELRDLYGRSWSEVSIPTSFGARFKGAITSGLLDGIRHYSLHTNNHNAYEVYK